MRIMKRYIYFTAVIMTCLLGVTCLSSCLNNDDDVDVVKNIIVEVDSTPCDVYPFGWDVTNPAPGMRIKEENSKEWQNESQYAIDGFTFEPGYFYTLKVKKTILANPPADSGNVRYQLIEVLKKEKDDSHSNLLKSVKADDYELCYEYDDNGRVTSFKSKKNSSLYEESHDAVYTYDDIRHLVSITDTWRHHYFNDNTSGAKPEISVNITVYLDSVYNRVDSIVEKNSSMSSYSNTNKFVRYFNYNSDNHLVGISNNWHIKQQQINWELGDIVDGINENGHVSFMPSAISNTCPSIDSRNSFLTILDKPLLMAGLFGTAPEHLEQSHYYEWYTCTYDYTTDSGKVLSVEVTLTNSEQVVEKSRESYTWQTRTLSVE